MILENVLMLCKKKGISVRKLEMALGFGNGTIRCWKSCSPRVDALVAVADFFGVSLDRLAGREVLQCENTTSAVR